MIQNVNIGTAQICVHQILIPQATATIVFLHDSLGSIELWRDFPQTIGRLTHSNVLMYDREGYGRSSPFATIRRSNDYLEKEADVLYQLITQLQLKNIILFGHSDGASIALIFAAKYPGIVLAVVSEAAHIFVEQQTLSGIQEAVRNYQETDLKKRLMKYHGDKTEAVFHAWTDTWLEPGFEHWSIEHFLPGIICPTLIIQGDQDEFGTIKQVIGIAHQVSGTVEVLIVPDIGHTPHKEAPIITVKAVEKFLTQILPNIVATKN